MLTISTGVQREIRRSALLQILAARLLLRFCAGSVPVILHAPSNREHAKTDRGTGGGPRALARTTPCPCRASAVVVHHGLQPQAANALGGGLGLRCRGKQARAPRHVPRLVVTCCPGSPARCSFAGLWPRCRRRNTPGVDVVALALGVSLTAAGCWHRFCAQARPGQFWLVRWGGCLLAVFATRFFVAASLALLALSLVRLACAGCRLRRRGLAVFLSVLLLLGASALVGLAVLELFCFWQARWLEELARAAVVQLRAVRPPGRCRDL